ncbi:MAG: hypothetical protein AAB215_01455 [Planctomycetota bacterium]
MGSFRFRRRSLAALLLAAPLASGCAYAKDRLNDLADPWTVGVECMDIPFAATAQAGIFNAGLGIFSSVGLGAPQAPGHGPGLGFGIGWLGRNGPTPYGLMGMHGIGAGITMLYGPRDTETIGHRVVYLAFVDTRFWDAIGVKALGLGPESYEENELLLQGLNVEAAGGVILGGRAGINLFEILDFLAGFTTLDIAGDDGPTIEERVDRLFLALADGPPEAKDAAIAALYSYLEPKQPPNRGFTGRQMLARYAATEYTQAGKGIATREVRPYEERRKILSRAIPYLEKKSKAAETGTPPGAADSEEIPLGEKAGNILERIRPKAHEAKKKGYER